MDMMKTKSTKSTTKKLITKAWKLCTTTSSPNPTSSSCSSTSCTIKKKKGNARRVAPVPAGCFPVYVGPEKKRFVLKAEFVNHPSFMVLLEDAALEYGYRNDGPLLLPCDVDLFYDVLAEIEGVDEINEATTMSYNKSPIKIFLSPFHLNSRLKNGYGDGDGYRLPGSSSMNEF